MRMREILVGALLGLISHAKAQEAGLQVGWLKGSDACISSSTTKATWVEPGFTIGGFFFGPGNVTHFQVEAAWKRQEWRTDYDSPALPVELIGSLDGESRSGTIHTRFDLVELVPAFQWRYRRIHASLGAVMGLLVDSHTEQHETVTSYWPWHSPSAPGGVGTAVRDTTYTGGDYVRSAQLGFQAGIGGEVLPRFYLRTDFTLNVTGIVKDADGFAKYFRVCLAYALWRRKPEVAAAP